MSRTARNTVVLALCVLLALGIFALSGCKKKEEPKVTKKTVTPYEAPKKEEPPILWPFTGLKADSLDATHKRPLSVKIENSNLARPQKGISFADVVYETIAEGGITRFNCIFHSYLPKELGPTRSARLSDCYIVPQYNTILFFSGANSQVISKLRANKIADMSQNKAASLYHRVTFRSAPHNLYLRTADWEKVAAKHKYELTSTRKGLNFDTATSEETSSAATTVSIPFSPYAKIKWEFDSANKVYKRINNGAVHKDASTNKQVTAKNVVVMWAKYVPQSKRDKVGSVTYDIILAGEGKASVFINGGRIDGTWKATKKAPPRFYDKTGKEITLKPGKTWFEVPPTDIKITTSSAAQ